jgi:membrane protein required for beta-lactamase induction
LAVLACIFLFKKGAKGVIEDSRRLEWKHLATVLGVSSYALQGIAFATPFQYFFASTGSYASSFFGIYTTVAVSFLLFGFLNYLKFTNST